MSSIHSFIAHIRVLEARHAELDEEIAMAFQHNASDEEIKRLKWEKLRLKDEIAHLKHKERQWLSELGNVAA